MSEDGHDGTGVPVTGLPVKEYEERTLGAARLHYLLRQECGIEDPWHMVVLAVCAFDKLHLKDGWEFVLTNRRDIEEVGQLFENSSSPEEFRDGLIALKQRGLAGRPGDEETDA